MIRSLYQMAGLLSLVMLLLALMTMTSPAKAADREAEERIKQAEMALNSEEYEKAARLFAESRELSQQLEIGMQSFALSVHTPESPHDRASQLLTQQPIP